MTNRLDTSHAIATAYRNFEFRSRLEAKWAVFFDLCGWKWSYEPIDCNGWIPDFAIGHEPTLVEVKPFFHLQDFAEARAKIVRSGYRKDVVLLGCDPTWRNDERGSDAPPIGWLDCYWDDALPGSEKWIAWDLHFGFTEGNNRIGLCPMQGAWNNVIWKAPTHEFCTHPNKWSRVSLHRPEQIEKELVARWAEACNVSKWIPLNEARKNSRNIA